MPLRSLPARRTRARLARLGALILLAGSGLAFVTALAVPTDVQLPGTQPGEVAALDDPSNCGNCHGGYDPAVEPFGNWQSSPMAHASRDPLFWAAVAVAEQDYPGAGDLCHRCHTSKGWLAGHSTPTDGSALLQSEATSVSCDLCHRLTNPDDSEHLGVQNPPFVANDGGSPAEGYYGSGMFVLFDGTQKLGPYAGVMSPHGAFQSAFHRSPALCGTCHDVSNPVVGDLAHNNGAMVPLQPGTFSGVPGAPVAQKAAFNNPPHAYGIVERTYSEHVISLFPQTLVSNYASLPADLQAGSIQRARDLAVAARPDGNYLDGTPRAFTCQSCHMPPINGKGARQPNAPVRADLPLHELVGGNTWLPDALVYLDGLGKLVLGGGLTAAEVSALGTGKARAVAQLQSAAALKVSGDLVRVVNLTGHKLLTGYPEGRRMWLNVRWYDSGGTLLREDGEYGPLAVTVNGAPGYVDTLLDPHGPNTRLYAVEPGMTREWAAQLLALGTAPGLALSFDRQTGAVTKTLGSLAADPPGSAHPTQHFVLNNTILSDSRIPPYGMDRDAALERSALPVPASQFGDPGPGGVYDYFDDVSLDPPAAAVTASIRLMHQPTSWEYVQFLQLANDGTNALYGSAGDDLVDAWLNTGMAAPTVMSSVGWTRSACSSAPVTYCTAGTTTNGCVPSLTASGLASASAGFGFTLEATGVEGSKQGLIFYGFSGRLAKPWGVGGTSYLCVRPPVRRADVQSSGGTPGACDGRFRLDWNTFVSEHPLALGGVAPGQVVQAQAWFRDPPAPRTTNLTAAVEFMVCP